MSDSATRILAGLLEARTGQQLGLSRRWRIETALQPLMRERSIASLDQLAGSLVGGREPALAEKAVEALLNNETFFYRDRPAFDLLLGPVLSRLERARAGEKRIAIWCAGCSTGQEAYSIAMRIAEQKARWAGWTIDILGSDVSRAAIERASSGHYSQFEVQRGLSVLQMMRWFAQQPGTWRISSEIQRLVRFRVHSLIEPPPEPGRFDLILCRNVMLYFAEPTRRLVFSRLAEAAAEDAVLMLGAGETVIGQTEAFAPDPEARGLYVRTGKSAARFAAAS
ncbi:MAG: protein-glutamate O-methyltransferase CheR [Alphaproteobacteria bacterium]|nr:protein-glutamate O-methyltransferase CheR [Alphaproteobacteria bacterium]MBV9370236.1 protein-glutamate O-methyltransferase CheR [Alphaproteobacteria bacterium]MBV9899721.1 protein-glutamate O-methyltransferase CheR [Alphaproteobacteria bacterium]